MTFWATYPADMRPILSWSCSTVSRPLFNRKRQRNWKRHLRSSPATPVCPQVSAGSVQTIRKLKLYFPGRTGKRLFMEREMVRALLMGAWLVFYAASCFFQALVPVHTGPLLQGSASGTILTCPCRLTLASVCLCLPPVLCTLTLIFIAHLNMPALTCLNHPLPVCTCPSLATPGMSLHLSRRWPPPWVN